MQHAGATAAGQKNDDVGANGVSYAAPGDLRQISPPDSTIVKLCRRVEEGWGGLFSPVGKNSDAIGTRWHHHDECDVMIREDINSQAERPKGERQ